MKKFLFLMLAVSLVACAGKRPDGAAMLEQLNEQHLSLLVYNHDSLSGYNQRGVRDLLMLVQHEPQRLQGAVAADKIIGKASAALMVLGGVREVHTNTICTPARQMLEKAGVKLHYEEEIPYIINRDKTGQCPLDSRLSDVDNADECLSIIEDFYAPSH